MEVLDAFPIAGTRHYTLLNTNEPPADPERIFIDSVISKTEARLVWLDDEIPKLREKLKQLEYERASLPRYVTCNKAALAPLRRMPPEVLGEIFSWTLPTIANVLNAGKFDMAQSPWLLTQISSRWRAVSLSIPSLWSRVVIQYPRLKYTAPGRIHYSHALAETQISRAQTLKIHFYCCEQTDPRPQIHMFYLLSQHSSRWEELSLALTPKMLPLLTTLRNQLPSLRRLWMEWDGGEDEIPVESLGSFHLAPSLVEFGLSNETCVLPITFPIHQLTRLQFDGPWERHRGILKLAPNLVEAHIEVFHEETWPEIGEIIDLPYLRGLYVSDHQVLDYLRAPALVGIGLVGWEDGASDVLESFAPFLDRSACILRRLTLVGFPDTHTTTRILAKLPSVTEFAVAIDDSDASERVNLLMSTLTISQASGVSEVAPQLRCLLFGCQSDSSIDYNIFLKMLESRWRAEHCPLKAAALLMEDPVQGLLTCDGFRALRREGMDLSVMVEREVSTEIKGWAYATRWN
ncbi:hypothetical protein DFH08DRAFT_967053 [Mycena albidolilacea]|uniref:F-box domain-containing protein n=1 Tax=Mycena albidolilacea TaxID=1033008 RepID=A0AAD6ZNA5_9AGAR|nr:hypothetical protein DFH08DRAFT_967053 [Mycena albidolilacea]